MLFTKNSSLRNFQDKIGTVGTVAAFIAALFTVAGFEHILVLVCKKSIHTLVDFEYNISAFSAVTAIRSACRDVFLTAETDVSVTALS